MFVLFTNSPMSIYQLIRLHAEQQRRRSCRIVTAIYAKPRVCIAFVAAVNVRDFIGFKLVPDTHWVWCQF